MNVREGVLQFLSDTHPRTSRTRRPPFSPAVTLPTKITIGTRQRKSPRAMQASGSTAREKSMLVSGSANSNQKISPFQG